MWTFQDISFCQFFLHPIPAKHSWTNSRLESGGMVGEIVTTVHTGFHWKGWAGKVEGVLLDNFHDAKSKGTKQRSGIPVGSSPSDLERSCPIWCGLHMQHVCASVRFFIGVSFFNNNFYFQDWFQWDCQRTVGTVSSSNKEKQPRLDDQGQRF